MHKLSFEQLLREIELADAIQQQSGWLPKSFFVVSDLLRKRIDRHEELCKF